MSDKIEVDLMDIAYSAPERATEFSVGYDIYSAEDQCIRPLDRKLIRTGFKLHLPVGIEAQIRTRSGLANKHGVFVLNSPGTIDPDYRVEVKVLLFNSGPTPFDIESILKQITNRTYQIKNAIEFMRFNAGLG